MRQLIGLAKQGRRFALQNLIYNGLPPGPIAIAIRPAIDAVLKRESHDFLFFCAREDFSGYHNFTKDFDAHLRNARIYQAALNKAGIH